MDLEFNVPQIIEKDDYHDFEDEEITFIDLCKSYLKGANVKNFTIEELGYIEDTGVYIGLVHDKKHTNMNTLNEFWFYMIHNELKNENIEPILNSLFEIIERDTNYSLEQIIEMSERSIGYVNIKEKTNLKEQQDTFLEKLQEYKNNILKINKM